MSAEAVIQRRAKHAIVGISYLPGQVQNDKFIVHTVVPPDKLNNTISALHTPASLRVVNASNIPSSQSSTLV